jgi:asparagine synthase (glutamine-hydrolysing)
MCGICGISWNDENLIRVMGHACKHRGPEQEGFYVDDHVSLCCERLKIQDLSENAKQPLHNEDGTIWVVLNGEIYNFKEIRNQLEKKHKFYTNSDTEVILHAYEEYGEVCIDKLDGMFAFAIYDTKKKIILLARDRIGVKPLYYHFNNGRLSFASEIKSILQNQEIRREINNDALCQLLIYAYTIDGQTLFNDIKELPPGHKLVYYFSDKKIQTSQYWNLGLNENKFDEKKNLEILKKLLTKAVDKRQVSDASIGALLSGGLDSSVMVAILSRLSDKPVKTFTTGFGHDLDEFDEARLVAEHCQTDHKEIMLDYSDLVKTMPSILWHMEFPFGRPSILSNFMVARDIKKYVTVAYTGEGSDELFGGYNRYLIYAHEKNKSSLDEKIKSIPSGFFKDKNTIEKFFSKMISAHYDSPNNPSNAFGNIVKSSSVSLLNKALFFEIKTEIPGAQTWRIDRAGSAHAVELREPFLDHKLVEFCVTIPPQLKIEPLGLGKKIILQKLATELLPEKIVKRKKFPWGIPFYDFFKNEFLPVAEDLLEKSYSHRRSYLNIDDSYVKKICDKASQVRNEQSKNTEIDDSILRQILFLFNLELWDQIFIKNNELRNPNLSLDKFL